MFRKLTVFIMLSLCYAVSIEQLIELTVVCNLLYIVFIFLYFVLYVDNRIHCITLLVCVRVYKMSLSYEESDIFLDSGGRCQVVVRYVMCTSVIHVYV